jgi:hypothetical protein
MKIAPIQKYRYSFSITDTASLTGCSDVRANIVSFF